MKIPAHAKYQIIYDTLQKNDNLLNVAAMCEIAGVSRSGYYHYLSTEDQRMEREERDRQDFLLILKAYQYRGYHKGARSIYMRLLHMEPPIVMNIKKIRRLMRKYNLQCPIRKANPLSLIHISIILDLRYTYLLHLPLLWIHFFSCQEIHLHSPWLLFSTVLHSFQYFRDR